MRKYAQGELKKSTRFNKYVKEDAHACGEIVQDLLYKADGVFLWLSLALQDLKAGLNRLDSVEMLRKRIQCMQSSLNGIFRQLLKNFHDVHRPQVAHFLRMVTSGSTSSALHAFGAQPLLAQMLWTCIEPNAPDQPDSVIFKYQQQFQDLESILLTQCAGLLNISVRGCYSSSIDRCICNSEAEHLSTITRLGRHYLRQEVKLAHRSVLEFLEQDDAVRPLVSDLLAPSEDLDISLIKACHGAVAVSLQYSTELLRRRRTNNNGENGLYGVDIEC